MTDQINTPATAEAAHAKAESKSAIVTKLLKRTRGATMDEMMTATTWQAHSVRAFLSGLRKKGDQLAKEQRKPGQLAYRITMPAPAACRDDRQRNHGSVGAGKTPDHHKFRTTRHSSRRQGGGFGL